MKNEQNEKNAKIKAKIIAKAWKDPAFKKRLLQNPKAVFEEMGAHFPKNATVRVVEDTANTLTFVLPPALKGKELTEAELEKLAGGAGTWILCSTMCD